MWVISLSIWLMTAEAQTQVGIKYIPPRFARYYTQIDLRAVVLEVSLTDNYIPGREKMTSVCDKFSLCLSLSLYVSLSLRCPSEISQFVM